MEIAAQALHKLVNKDTGEPLRVVDHIGCHYAKTFPERGIGGSEFPQVLTGLITAWGGTPVDYPERRHCCGFGFRNYLVQQNRGYSISQSKIKLESMKPYQPDLIVANCPGCAMFLDRWQYTLEETDGSVYGQDGSKIPVLTHEELAGLVLGYDPWEIGLQTHQVPVEDLLDKIGIAYDINRKYSDRLGHVIGEPQLINQQVC
jgi:heterodisulfide reductase subunit B